MKIFASFAFASTALALVTPAKLSHRASALPSPACTLNHAQTASTQYVTINNTTCLAYRHFGTPSTYPLLYLTHFRGSMDVTDPLLINLLASNREIILVDNSGIGHSSGAVPPTIQEMGDTMAAFLSAIQVPRADVLGFSMGGMVAQYFAMQYPEKVHKLVLAAVRPGHGPDVVAVNPEDANGPGGEATSQPTKDYMLGIFFANSSSSRAKGDLWWDRIYERDVAGEERKGFLVGEGVQRQLDAIVSFASDPSLYARLDNITMPVLVSNGKRDLLMGTQNSVVLQQRLRDARLALFPDSGHGHLWQFPAEYAELVEAFLRG
ncbi:Alpha beta fold family [Stemphylium lycopersici]|nr:Alpha beta fold family [Stemphylium lycopersici]